MTVGSQTIQEIPTASTLGLGALALLLAGAAFVALRRVVYGARAARPFLPSPAGRGGRFCFRTPPETHR